MPLVEPLSGFVDATSRDAGVSTSVALGQVYAPTGYPGRLTIVPGVVITQPAKYDYAPDIVVAERKVRASFAAARAGRVAVVNIHVEPGAGKTLHLPRKFTDSKCLVVLPTVFDTWSAWSNRPQDTGIEVYGYSKPAQGPVTYTDSYHAAWMLVNGRIGDYSVVFVDESDSDTGLTPFLSEAARGGVVFVRMTASPQTSVGRPTFSFPVAEEHDVPDQSDIQASARYVDRKRKDRTLVLCSTADVAEALVSLVPGCSLLTVRTPLDQLERLFDDIVSPITLVADSVSGRGVNLNIDCTIDFGLVADSNGLERQITFSERLQRRGRVGRSKPGVYCCAFAGTTTRQLDQTAVFRNNLWRQVVGGRLAPCGFQCPADPKRVHELIASIAGDIEEDPNLAVPARASVAPSSDGGRTVFSGDGERTRRMYCSVVIDEDESFSGLNEEKSFNPARVDWYGYYTASTNHPSRYVADLVFDHRQVNVASIQLDRQVAIKRADNRVFDPESPKLVHRNPESRVATGLGGYGNQGTVVKSESRRGSDTLSVAPDLGQARGTVAYDVSPYDSRSLGPVGVRDLGGDFAAADGPLVLMRASKVSRYSRGTAYTAASVCHGFFTVYGLVLASGNDLHPALRPIDPSARDSLRAFTGSAGAVDAEYMLTYVTTIPVRDVNVADKRGMLTRRGAWSIPTCCTVPAVDISGDDYHADWDEVISERIKGKLPLPMFVPRNAPRATTRYRYVNTSKLEHAMEVCEDPTYNADEQAVVYSAWDQLAVESCVLSGRRLNLFPAAAALLSYMVRADRLNNRGTPRVGAGGFQGQSRHAY